LSRCFCIQPFDKDVYDKRFDDVFKPAIEAAGLEAYRVDRDPAVIIPIEDIEREIKNSAMCFAEITTNNPNVWYELGYAFAISKNVIMVCSEERTSEYPFDIKHRTIIPYKAGSISDFTELKVQIKKKISALLKKEENINNTKNISPIADTEGLSQHEMVALVTIMQNCFTDNQSVSTYLIKEDMSKAGFTDIATSLALMALRKKNFIKSAIETEYNGSEYYAYFMEQPGIDWLLRNQEKLVLQKEINQVEPDEDDSLPF